MAQEFSIRNEFACDEDTFWETFFAEDFNRRLFFDVLKFPNWKHASFKKEESEGVLTKVDRVMHVVPPMTGTPAPLKKAMGEKFSYDETGSYSAATRKYDFNIRTSTLADKIRVGGVLYTEKLGEKRCVRVAKLTVEVKIFMIGSMAEEGFLHALRASYEATAGFIETYLKEKGRWAAP